MLPIGAAGFLGWVVVKSLLQAPASQLCSLVAIVGIGFILMAFARIVLRPQFFHLERESDTATQ